MNNLKHIVEGKWDKIKGNIQEEWGEITDDQLEEINGSYRKLKGKLQESYGYTADEAEEEIQEFLESNNLIKKIKEKAEDTYDEIKDNLSKLKSTKIGDTITHYVTQEPIKVLGITAAAILLISLLYKNNKNC